MHKLLLFLVVNVLLMNTALSQVFVSQVIKNQLLLGPDNVSTQMKTSAPKYLLQIEEFTEKLTKKEKEVSQQIAEYAGIEKLKKKDKKKLERLNTVLADMKTEFGLVTQLKESWAAIEMEQEILRTLRNQVQDKVCFEVSTNQGNYSNKQIKIKTVKDRARNQEEFIKVNSCVQTGKWVKKKKYPNCFSQNPDDCYVACYEKKIEGFRIEDMTGKVVTLKKLPTGMRYHEKDKRCYRTKNSSAENKLLGFRLLDTPVTTEPIEILDWEKVECASK